MFYAYLLHCLLCHQQKWSWDDKRAGAFAATKQALVSSDVLIHYDPNLPLTLVGDTSAYGLGAVLSHTLPDGTEYPIVFASQLKEIMLNWKRWQHLTFLESRNSTSISMSTSLPDYLSQAIYRSPGFQARNSNIGSYIMATLGSATFSTYL